jgi:hypothetical protein
MTLWVVDQEERIEDLNRVVQFIKLYYSYGAIDIDDVAAECGVENLTNEEVGYIEDRLNR